MSKLYSVFLGIVFVSQTLMAGGGDQPAPAFSVYTPEQQAQIAQDEARRLEIARQYAAAERAKWEADLIAEFRKAGATGSVISIHEAMFGRGPNSAIFPHHICQTYQRSPFYPNQFHNTTCLRRVD